MRGLRKMIENDRYFGDEIQQASAIIAAVREVALMLIERHLETGASVAAISQRKPVIEEMRAVLQLALVQSPGLDQIARDTTFPLRPTAVWD